MAMGCTSLGSNIHVTISFTTSCGKCYNQVMIRYFKVVKPWKEDQSRYKPYIQNTNKQKLSLIYRSEIYSEIIIQIALRTCSKRWDAAYTDLL